MTQTMAMQTREELPRTPLCRLAHPKDCSGLVRSLALPCVGRANLPMSDQTSRRASVMARNNGNLNACGHVVSPLVGSHTPRIVVGSAGASPYRAPGSARLPPSRDQSSGRASVMTRNNGNSNACGLARTPLCRFAHHKDCSGLGSSLALPGVGRANLPVSRACVQAGFCA